MSGFEITGEQTLHRGPVISLATLTMSAPDGSSHTREVVRHPGAVSVVPLLDEDTVVLVRQFRAALGTELLEIPAGKRDVTDEPPEHTAARELAEEVGYRAGELEQLAVFHNSPGFCDEHSIVYLARDLAPCDPDRQGVEEIHLELVEVALDDVASMIASGDLRDAKTVIGLLLTLRRFGR